MSDIESALRASRTAPAAAAEASRRMAEAAVTRGLADVAYGWADSPFGPLLVGITRRGLVRLAYPNERPDDVLEELAVLVSPRVLEWPAAVDAVRRQLEDYFAGGRRGFELPVDWSLTRGFGRKVLRATARIPFGRVSTYRDVAARAGSPAGARAAGNALGANPIPIVVPCHRVVHSGGGLGGYTGGLDRKELLLRLEGVLPSEPPSVR
ncbi:MAG: methylated-DNA--[protein]-cysteine S-methyltransferase [Actinomycetota bacterium]|nr:methylated-DNA--[protein]-cysteine S-methyltransferase [Actinomycetota bacterium]